MPMHRRAALLAALIAAGSLAMAATPSASEGFAFSTYREKVNGVIVLVDSFPASLHDHDAFIPLHIAVGLVGHRGPVTITPESFTLIDRDGNSYPLATYQQILRDYGKVSFDRSLVRARPLVIGSQFAISEEIEANFFSPVRVVRDQIHLANFTWFHDLLYFPHPEAGLGGVLQLRLTGKGLEQPIDVAFKVPLTMREESGGR